MGAEIPELDELKAIHNTLYDDGGFGGGCWGADGWESDADSFDDWSDLLGDVGQEPVSDRPSWEPDM